MKRILKFILFIVLFPMLILITYSIVLFLALHAYGLGNLAISTITTLSIPYIFVASVGYGIYKIKKNS